MLFTEVTQYCENRRFCISEIPSLDLRSLFYIQLPDSGKKKPAVKVTGFKLI